ncbi:hypothetical protein, partial [Escherichia coli]|uniref:CDP-alcohol phosphatidyltransferase family protein n=5 Tax=Pseudomonadota TaxID=1224 RepID=UPI001BC8AA79
YIAGAALRLARFNVNIGVVDKRFFQGLPSPAAAALVIGLIWSVVDGSDTPRPPAGSWINWAAYGITLFAGLSMVTNAPFYSFKVFDRRRSVPFVVLVAIMLAIGLAALDPSRVLFGVFCVYGLSGYVIYAWR